MRITIVPADELSTKSLRPLDYMREGRPPHHTAVPLRGRQQWGGLTWDMIRERSGEYRNKLRPELRATLSKKH